MELTRRDLLKASGLALGGMAMAGGMGGCPIPACLPKFTPQEALDPDKMRITFLGTSVIPRLAQQCNSVFVEVGSGDSFVFDCGSGVSSKYNAMQIQYSRMDKVFLTHLHGDHTSDLITIYCFGPSVDRKVPLRVWGPSADTPEQGTKAFCDTLYKLMEWHRHSFSFIATGLKPPAGYDSYDGFDIIATELEYMEVGGIAYQNETTGVTIRHFPALHARNGSISYKLEWNGMSMIFSGDTKPNDFMIEQGKGVDVLIHEMVVPPEVWAAKNSGFQEGDAAWDQALQLTKDIEDSSHTPQKAFGYIMSQTNPRLAVATHFQADDETVGPALDDIRRFYDGDVTIATDLLVIDVSKDDIRLRQGDVSDFAWYPPNPKIYNPQDFAAPMYPTPTAQLSDELLAHVVQPILYNPALPPA